MNDSKISVRYAKALFQTAVESGIEDAVMLDIKLLSESLRNEAFKEVMESPVIKTSQKKELIRNVFSKAINELTFNFLKLILDNRRETYLPDIIRNFSGSFREHKGIKKAEVIISSAIDQPTRKKFEDILKKTFKSGIELDEIIRPEIIGGFILKVEDRQYDASVVNSLARIRKNLLQTSIEK